MLLQQTSSTVSSSQSLVFSIQQSLESCSKDDSLSDSGGPIYELVEFLNSCYDVTIADSDDNTTINDGAAVLSHVHSYLSNPSLDQAVIDALSFELPKPIAKFAGVSSECATFVDRIIDQFITKCHPRDMILVLCEALNSYGKATDAPGYVASLLRGLSKVIISIQRRQFEQIKAALPAILGALNIASFCEDNENLGMKDVFEEAISIATSIQAICKKLEGVANEQLRALLGLYILQIMTFVSISMGNVVSDCLYLIRQLSSFFPYCALSYADLMTDQGVGSLISLVCSDDADDCLNCFTYVKHGAVLSVIWGHISDEVAQTAGQDLCNLKNEVRSTQNRRSSAVGMLKYIFSLGMLPWTFKKFAINFLLDITDNLDEQEMNEDIMGSFDLPSVINTLQAIVSVIINAPDAEIRKNGFVALKRVLAHNPATLRIDIIQVLVKTSSSSSMTAILLDCVREDLRNDYRKLQEKKVTSSNSVWCAGILDLVEIVLKPPTGGPPILPEQSDAVLSALNLYRFVFISESTGKTNYTGVMSRSNIEMVYKEWLLPLRNLVKGVLAENNADIYDELAMDVICGLNPLEFVLYRCIELVEDKLNTLS